jgi:hypothetical protein
LKTAVDHVVAVYGLNETQDEDALRKLLKDKSLEEPLPGFPEPAFCQQCEGCKNWILQAIPVPGKRWLLSHIQSHHRRSKDDKCKGAKKGTYSDYRSSWTVQLLRWHNGPTCRVAATYYNAPPPHSQSERSPRPQRPTPLVPYHAVDVNLTTVPIFFDTLGWSKYLSSTGFDLDVARALVKSPLKRLPSVQLTERELAVERGLHRIQRFAAYYLVTADETMQDLGPHFRRRMTANW